MLEALSASFSAIKVGDPFDASIQMGPLATNRQRDRVEGYIAKGKAEGREVRGISDHKFIRSIYFCDPNGYVIELTAKVTGHDRDMDPTANHARDILNRWQVHKRKAHAEAAAS